MQSGYGVKQTDQDDNPVAVHAFELFEFAHLLRIRPRIWKRSSTSSRQQGTFFRKIICALYKSLSVVIRKELNAI